MMTMLRKLWKDEEGASAAEYVLILALASLAIIAGATALGTNMDTVLNAAATAVDVTPNTGTGG